MYGSQCVQVVAQGWQLHLDVLTFTNPKHEIHHLAGRKGIPGHALPVVKDALREGLAARLLPQCRHEAEGLPYRKVRFHLHEWSSFSLVLFEHAASPHVQAGVDTAGSILRTNNFDQEHRLLKGRLARQLCSEAAASSGWHDLTSTAVNSVSVEGHVSKVETDTSHVFLAQWPLLGGPLESAVHMLFDLQQVLDGSRVIYDDVWALRLGTPAPDLPGMAVIPFVVFPEDSRPLFRIGLWPKGSLLHPVCHLVIQRLCHHVDAVMLIRRLRQASLIGDSRDSLPVRDNWVRDSEVALGILLSQVLQTDLDMKLPAARNDVLATFLSGADHKRI
mmetsp:Transcript_2823/g.6624  ORF Transcript_2823/g.6624 Transcript_2823/m.6624 type:complete len:332 (-) Transcript_2823:911-1906(-)